MAQLPGRLHRRTLLAGLTASAVGASVFATAGCSSSAPEPAAIGTGTNSGDVVVPTFAVPDGLPTPDLEGISGRVSSGYLSYPATPRSVTHGAPGDGSALTAAYPIWGAAPVGVDSNRYWQAMNTALNMDFKPTLVPQADYNDKFSVMVAGGDMPDLVVAPLYFPRFPDLLKASFADLSAHLSGDAAAEYPNLAYLGEDTWRTCVFNGSIYAVPQPSEPMSSVMFARRDLLDDLGLNQDPTSLAEFVELCQTVTDKKSDRFAVTSITGVTTLVLQAYGLPYQWSESDGTFTHRIETEEYLDAVAAVADLWSKGVFHPDAPTAPTSAAKGWFESGVCLFHSDGYNVWSPTGLSVSAVANSMDPIKQFGAEGGPGTVARARLFYRLMLIPKADEDRIRVLLKILDYLSAPFGTSEYLLKTYGEAGTHHTLEGTDPILTDLGKSETTLTMAGVARPPAVNYNPGAPDITRRRHAYAIEAQAAMVPDPTTGLYSSTDQDKGGQLLLKINDLQNQVILGRAKVSDLAPLVDSWRKEGGNAIRAEYEQAKDH